MSDATITFETLREKNACQRWSFRELFGDSVVVTEELAAEHAGRFDWNWAAHNLLPEAEYDEFRNVRLAADAEYDTVTNKAYNEYETTRDAVLEKYRTVEDATYADYEDAKEAAWVLYDQAVDTAYEVKSRTLAIAWARLYIRATTSYTPNTSMVCAHHIV